MHKFDYYLPLTVRLVFLGMSTVLALGAFGFLDESFGQTVYHKVLMGFLFIFSTYLLCVPPYKGPRITITEEYVEVPNIIFPPFKNHRINFSEVINVKHKIYGREPDGIEIITIIGNARKLRIVNYFCHDFSVSWKRILSEGYLEVRALLSHKFKDRFGLTSAF